MLRPRPDRAATEAISAKVEGDVSGQLAVGHHIIQVYAEAGAHVNAQIAQDVPVPRRRKAAPAGLAGRDFPDLVGRTSELDQAAGALADNQPVEICGDAGLGKTSLLRRLAHSKGLPDTVIFTTGAGMPRRDLLQLIYSAFYETDTPYLPDETTCRTLLSGCDALVAIDDADLARSELQTLLGDVPSCRLAFTREMSYSLGEGCSLALAGLSEDEGVALLERRLGRPVADRASAVALVRELHGRPLALVQAAAQLEAGREGAPVTPEQQRILDLLAAVAGGPLGTERIAELSGGADTQEALDDLEARGLVQSHSPRYSLTEPPVHGLGHEGEIGELLAYFTDWAENSADPRAVVDEAPALFALMERGLVEGEPAAVVRLGLAVERPFAATLRWDGWELVLSRALTAAKSVEDGPAQGYLLHQLGSRALCLDQREIAEQFLVQALDLREALGDRSGADATRHNLQVLRGGPPPPPPNGRGGPRGHWPPSLPVIGVIALVAAAGIGVFAATRSSNQSAPATSQASQSGPQSGGGPSTGTQTQTQTQTNTTPSGGSPVPKGLTADVQSVAFDDTQVGGTSSPKTVTVTNPNGQPIGLSFTTPDSSTIEPSDSSSCSQGDLAPNATCTIIVTFAPDQAGRSNATLVVTETASPAGPPLKVPLSGVGVAPNLTFNPNPLAFDSTLVGSTGAPKLVTVTDAGIGDVTIGGSGAGGDFAVAKDGCNGATLPKGGTCEIAVSFTPTAEGARTGTLSVPLTSPQGSFSLPLTGFGSTLK